MLEKITILLNKEAEQKEILDLEKIANSCGLKNFSVENTGGSRALGADMPSELVLIIKLATGALAGGFFGAIGVDLWKSIKKLFVKSFEYYEVPLESHIYNPQIYLEIIEGNELKFQVFFPTNKLKKGKVKKSLKRLEKFLVVNKDQDFSVLYYDISSEEWKISKTKFKKAEEYLKELPE